MYFYIMNNTIVLLFFFNGYTKFKKCKITIKIVAPCSMNQHNIIKKYFIIIHSFIHYFGKYNYKVIILLSAHFENKS